MANEVLYAGLADQMTAEILSGQYLQMIADRSALPMHPALFYAGDLAGTGSNTIKVSHLGLGAYDLPSVVADGAAIANTALTDSSTTIVVAGYSKAYERSDIARFVEKLGVLSAEKFAMDAAQSSAMRLTNLIANAVDDFSNTAGSTGVDMTLANFLTAINTLEVNSQAAIAEGEAMCVLHPTQLGDLRTALAASSTSGAAQWYQPSQLMFGIKGAGYRGRYMGVDLFSSNQVPSANAGADRAGGMFVRGAILWADLSVQVENSADQLVIGGKVLFERDRTAKSRLTGYVSTSYFGVSEGIDALGVSIITDL